MAKPPVRVFGIDLVLANTRVGLSFSDKVEIIANDREGNSLLQSLQARVQPAASGQSTVGDPNVFESY